MDSALISAPSSKGLRHILLVVVAVLGLGLGVGGCESPMSLDVDRSQWYADSTVHPTRLSFFYYFADSAYEAIVTDTSFLNEIWIERGFTPWRITVPQFNFSLSDTVHATFGQSPLVRQFSFSTNRQPVDGYYRTCVGANSWIEGEYLDLLFQRKEFRSLTNTTDQQLLIAWFLPSDQRLVKGRLVIRVANPSNPVDTATFNGLLTMEF